MVFLPVDPDSRRKCEEVFENIVRDERQQLLGWRTVPTDNSPIGPTAKAAEPVMRQIFIGRGDGFSDDLAFERKLYVIRKRVRKAIKASTIPTVPCSTYRACPTRRLSTKECSPLAQLTTYYPDLTDPSVEVALAMVHSRFSTNTFPNWARAHPYRSSATTVKSIHFEATSTGQAREKTYLNQSCLAPTSRKLCRS